MSIQNTHLSLINHSILIHRKSIYHTDCILIERLRAKLCAAALVTCDVFFSKFIVNFFTRDACLFTIWTSWYWRHAYNCKYRCISPFIHICIYVCVCFSSNTFGNIAYIANTTCSFSIQPPFEYWAWALNTHTHDSL